LSWGPTYHVYRGDLEQVAQTASRVPGTGARPSGHSGSDGTGQSGEARHELS
jgi:hypothetical protein